MSEDIKTSYKEKGGIQGLHTGTLSWLKAAGNAIAMNGPAATVALYFVGLASLAGGSFPLVVVISFFVYLGMMTITYEWSKVSASAYGWLAFQRKGFDSPMAAFFGGWYYYTYYFGTTAGFGMLGFATFAFLIDPSIESTYPWLWIPISIAIVVIDLILTTRGIRPSASYMLYTGLAEASFIIIASLIVIVRAGPSNSFLPFTAIPVGNSVTVILVSSILGFTTFGGLSSSVPVAEETKAPKKNIPKALLFGTLVVGVTLILASYAQAIGFGMANISNYAIAPDPGLEVFKKYLGTIGFILLAIFVLNSFNSDLVSNLTNTSRMTYGISRDGVLPKFFSKTNSKGVPSLSIIIAAVAAIVLGVAVGLVLGPLEASLFIVTGYSFAVYIEHVMGGIGLFLYHRRNHSLKFIRHLIIPFIVVVVLIVALVYSVYPAPAYPLNYLPLIILIWTMIGFAVYFYMKKKHPEEMSKLGEFSVK